MYSKKQISLKAWIKQKWSARKVQFLAKKYKSLGGGYY